MCCRMIGFILFWIAIGMIIALFLAENMFFCICVIIALILLDDIKHSTNFFQKSIAFCLVV